MVKCEWLFPAFIPLGGRRLGHVDGIGGRESALQALFEGSFEPLAALGLLILALSLKSRVFGHRFVGNTHCLSPGFAPVPMEQRARRARVPFPEGAGIGARDQGQEGTMPVMTCIEDMRRIARR